MHGEIEGRTEKLTKWEMETEAARRRLSARRGVDGARRSRGDGCGLPRCTANVKVRAGGSREGWRRLGADLKRPSVRGGTLPRRGVGAVAACGLAGRFRGARGEDGADKRARAVSGWAWGRGRLPGAACWAGAAAGPSSWGARLGRRLAGRAGKRERRVSGRAGKRPCGPKMRKGRR